MPMSTKDGVASGLSLPMAQCFPVVLPRDLGAAMRTSPDRRLHCAHCARDSIGVGLCSHFPAKSHCRPCSIFSCNGTCLLRVILPLCIVLRCLPNALRCRVQDGSFLCAASSSMAYFYGTCLTQRSFYSFCLRRYILTFIAIISTHRDAMQTDIARGCMACALLS